jgi:beta-N-acetylhexosaminidase
MTKRTALLFIISLCTFITSAQVTTNLYKQSDQKAVDHWVDSIYSTMSLDEKNWSAFYANC